MERVAFLIERTGERVSCLLNPESLETRRTAGIRTRREAGGFLAGRSRTDHPLIATGGGVTELDLRLLFDTGIAATDRGQRPASLQSADGATVPSEDVRTLTRPLWDLSENAFSDGFGAPPCVRFIWGKSWNMASVVIGVAERLEMFDANGTPQRSWLSLRLRRIEEPEPRAAPPLPVTPQFEPPAATDEDTEDAYPTLVMHVDDDGAPLTRLEQIASDRYGNPELARPLADYNGLDDMLKVEEGTVLVLPPAAKLWSGL
ncbi:MAG TPA: hypothetical protein VG889_07495 [Rhizomicrobium sp.]|nr:hypothetical protein [Rhizomicrobium sp.]